MMWRLALRNVFRHRTRSAITLSTIVFGCSTLIFIGGFFEDIYHRLQINEIETYSGHLQITQAGYRDEGKGDPYRFLISNYQEMITGIEELPGVRSVSPRLNLSGLVNYGETTLTFGGTGIDPKKEPMSRLDSKENSHRSARVTGGFLLAQGDPLSAGPSAEAALGTIMARDLGTAVGDSVIILTRTVDDSVNGLDVRVQATFESGVPELDEFTLRVPFETAQQLLRTDGVESLVVRLDRADDLKRIYKDIENLARNKGWAIEIVTWRDLSDFAIKSTQLFQRWYFVLNIIIMLIVLLSIYNTVSMSVIERTNEIGTLRALGNRRSDVIRLFLMEGLLIGILGGISGLVVGSLFTATVAKIGIVMPPSPGFSSPWLSTPLVKNMILAHVFILAVGVSFLSSFFPALRASKLEIADALRQVN